MHTCWSRTSVHSISKSVWFINQMTMQVLEEGDDAPKHLVQQDVGQLNLRLEDSVSGIFCVCCLDFGSWRVSQQRRIQGRTSLLTATLFGFSLTSSSTVFLLQQQLRIQDPTGIPAATVLGLCLTASSAVFFLKRVTLSFAARLVELLNKQQTRLEQGVCDTSYYVASEC